MKSVGNLDRFVRQHMLQPFPVEPRIAALIEHFNDLHRAHEAVLKAKAQIESLVPLVADCEKHAALSAQVDALRSCREALRPWFARRKGTLLERRIETLHAELARVEERLAALREARDRLQSERDELKRAIAENGGDRIERIKAEVQRLNADAADRRRRAARYEEHARGAGLPPAADLDTFELNRAAITSSREQAESERASAQNAMTDAQADLRELRKQYDEVERELASLRQRRSNIPARMLVLRSSLCAELGLDDGELPFAGELLQVQQSEAAWEGAVERVLHNFGLSLLVSDSCYASVAQWVDRTHLGERLVYYRVRPQRARERAPLHPDSLVHKVGVRPDSQFYNWLDTELAHRFDYACCETMDQFRRETRAITKSGQTKYAGERHEKDDRHRLEDRSRYVLGWTNDAKIAALEKQSRAFEPRIQAAAARFATAQASDGALVERLGQLRELAAVDSFRELEWRPLVARIDDLETERRKLESESDVLATLAAKLKEIERSSIAKTHR